MSDLFKRHKTRYRGITYRERQDGQRTYSVYDRGKQVAVEGGEKEALQLQASLRTRTAPIVPTRTRFKIVAEAWYEQKKPRLRRRTADYYRSALDLVLLPRFGNSPIGAIDADVIAKLVRDLEREGLHALDKKRKVRPLGQSSIENYLKPLQGTMAYAVRRKLIASNPFDVMTSDDRPKPKEKEDPYEWSDDELEALYSASETLAAKPESRYDYSHLIRISTKLGLRLGEALGLQWRDFDKTGSLSIKRQWTKYGEYGPTKTPAAVRTIALPPAVRDELIALRLESRYSNEDDPVFASRRGTPLSHRNVAERGFEAARDLAGIPEHLTFHDLRHAAASRLIYRGLDPVTVANVCGHEDASTTLKTYARLFNRRETNLAGRHYAAAELHRRGALDVVIGTKRIEPDLRAANQARTRTIEIAVRVKTAGDWQVSTDSGVPHEPEGDPTSFWILVDLRESVPHYFVAPAWWVENNIYEEHQAYLRRHGGHRAVSPDSKHHRITDDRVEQWRERWDILGISG